MLSTDLTLSVGPEKERESRRKRERMKYIMEEGLKSWKRGMEGGVHACKHGVFHNTNSKSENLCRHFN